MPAGWTAAEAAATRAREPLIERFEWQPLRSRGKWSAYI